MIIAFETEYLRELCEDASMACKVLGSEVSRRLILGLADIRAARTIFELPARKPRIAGDDGDLLEFELGSAAQMTWKANHPSLPTNEDGKIDWRRVTRIRLIQIGGY
jgi:hypothetical protein